MSDSNTSNTLNALEHVEPTQDCVKHDETTMPEQQESDKLGAKIGKTCTDVISRSAAIDAFTCNGSVFTYGDKVCKAIVSRIMQLPSAQPGKCEDCVNFNKARLLIPQPERKKGTWETVKSADGGTDFRCSACHRFRFHNGEMRKKYRYCPNCGLPMETEVEE